MQKRFHGKLLSRVREGRTSPERANAFTKLDAFSSRYRCATDYIAFFATHAYIFSSYYH